LKVDQEFINGPEKELERSKAAETLTKKPKRIKVLTQIIKRPKGKKNKDKQSLLKFSDDKISKLKDSIKSKNESPDQQVTTRTVFKTMDGQIIPESKLKLDEFDSEKITFPDPILKTVSNKKVHVIKDSKGNQISTTEHSNFKEEELVFTPKLPHPYLDPPKEVEGQLLRYWNKDEDRLTKNKESSTGFPPRVATPNTKEKLESTTQNEELDLVDDFNLPNNVLKSMLDLIDEGQITKEDVIEHLINNGFLPVEITELGRLPIRVGIPNTPRRQQQQNRPEEPRKRLRSKAQLRKPYRQREELAPERLKELTTTNRIPFDERRNRFQDIDISDPDFDFERVDPDEFEFGFKDVFDYEDFGLDAHSANIEATTKGTLPKELQDLKEEIAFKSTTEANPAAVTTSSFVKVDKDELKQIESVMSMIRMFENGQIDEGELLDMMAKMGQDIVGNSNPPNMQSSTEFIKFNEAFKPVKASFTNMNQNFQNVQEKPPMIENSQKSNRRPVFIPDTQVEGAKRPLKSSFVNLDAGQQAFQNFENIRERLPAVKSNKEINRTKIFFPDSTPIRQPLMENSVQPLINFDPHRTNEPFTAFAKQEGVPKTFGTTFAETPSVIRSKPRFINHPTVVANIEQPHHQFVPISDDYGVHNEYKKQPVRILSHPPTNHPVRIQSQPPLNHPINIEAHTPANAYDENLYYDDVSDHSPYPVEETYGVRHSNFPDFDNFDLDHALQDQEYHGPETGYLPPKLPSGQHFDVPHVPEPAPLYHPGPPYTDHYKPTIHEYPNTNYHHNVNEEPLRFDEMSHEAFAPPDAYGGPREPFGPPPALLDGYNPEYREIEAPYNPPEIIPDPQPHVKSLPEHPYGPYGEGYANYPKQAYNYPSYPPSYGYESENKPYDPYWGYKKEETPYVTSPHTSTHETTEDYPSPLYLHHGPGGYSSPAEQYFNPQTSDYYPRTGLDPNWKEYGQKVRESRKIDDLPDHTTLKPFAYDDLPLPPLTGHREIDRTISDIHKAFLEGDALSFKFKKSSKQKNE